MKSAKRGNNTSGGGVEVTNVSGQGIWILLQRGEFFLPFDQFPWFREATIANILHVEQPHPGHLYWPGLDVDIDVDSVEHPERYPLVSRATPRVTRGRPGIGGRRRNTRGTRRAPGRSR